MIKITKENKYNKKNPWRWNNANIQGVRIHMWNVKRNIKHKVIVRNSK
jgi:hypothetical protein